MTQLSSTEARKILSDLVNRVAFQKERISINRWGKNAVALVPIEDAELLDYLEARIDLAAARKALTESPGISWKKFKAQLGI
ncbi:MAG TPA: type II toxin-antitoxin system prevent-host-death family antitoxin [Candidatus Polarisedimenticolia bacterium]|jgi:prevent-host-death family protein